MVVGNVAVMVADATETEVGRTGAPGVLLVVGEAGQAMLPQRRSVAQQPPPRLTGQDLKPGEQVKGGRGVVVDGGVVVVGVDDAWDEETGVEELCEELVEMVVELVADVVAVTVGFTTTVVVEMRAPK